MATTPDRLKAETDQTREELSADVDRLADRISPKRKLHRGSERIRGAARNAKERVMGSAEQTTSQLQERAHDVAEATQDKAGQAADAIKSAPQQALRKTEGNPLAAGLIAFGAGLLAATLIPESRAEQQAGSQLATKGHDLAEPMVEAAKESSERLVEEAKSAAQTAGAQVVDTAKDAARTTSEAAQSQARVASQRGRKEPKEPGTL
jgi:ElaB/YqjD/DUF883 family membrane-anchored ribosome-binding protein